MIPLSGASVHYITPPVSWHGRLMVIAWGVLSPLGIIVARYFKVTAGQNWPTVLDNKFWWHCHRMLQYSAFALSIVAIGLVFSVAQGRTQLAVIHGWAGWIVIALVASQIATALLRGTKGGPTGERAAAGNWRGDHYDMTHRRVVFEYFHKTVGIIALLAAFATIMMGLVVADAPRWMPILISVWWICLLLWSFRLQRQGKCLDTYQAIWGPDPLHPGNNRAPIGVGVRSVAQERQAPQG